MLIITVYHRKFPVKGSPACASLVPYPTHQRHTYTVDNQVYEASFHESRVEVPDDSTIDQLKNLLCWSDTKGKMKSTAAEVLEFAKAKSGAFRVHSKK